MPTVTVIGGGISGLATAYYLAKAGASCTLVERRQQLGGVITTEVVDDCVIEGGPDSFLSAKPWAMDLIRDIGLADDVIGSNDHLRVTYVLRKGGLVPLPDGLMLMVPTRIMPMATSRLLGWGTKLSMGREWFRRAGSRKPDRSVSEFVEDHYGREAVDYLAEPLLAGVYGGSPDVLSVNSVLPRFAELEARYGSLTRAVLAERRKAAAAARNVPLFRTLKGGLGRLVAALEESVRPSTHVVHGVAEALERRANGFRIRVDGAWMESENVILACPAYEAGALLADAEPALAGLLGSIPYSSSLTVAMGYDKAGFRHRLNGFGFLIPRIERHRLIACTWVGTKFSNRVPENRVMLRCFLGGSDDPQILEESDEAIAAIVREELRRIMGVTEEPAFTRMSRWPRSMAQYVVGHGRRLEEIEERAGRIPGLGLAGNAYHGIGIPDCVRTGKQAAEQVSRRS